MNLSTELLNKHKTIEQQNETLEQLKEEKYKLKTNLFKEIQNILKLKCYPYGKFDIKVNEKNFNKFDNITIEIDEKLNNTQLEEIKKLLGFNSYTISYEIIEERGHTDIKIFLKIMFYNKEVVAND